MKKKVVPKLRQEVKVDIITCADIKIYFTGKFQDFTARYIIQEGHDGPVSLHWLILEIHPYQTLHYLGIGLKHKTPYKD